MKTFKLLALTVCTFAGAASLSLNPVQAKPNIAETAMSSDQFSTLVTAVKAAGLPPALKGKAPLTVFAPTNAAFAKLPAGSIEMLLKPENKATLVSILKYHIIAGKVPAKKAMMMASGSKVKTLNGETLILRTTQGVMLDPGMGMKATVIKPDIMTSNGIIHGIDTVLVPPSVQRAMMAMKMAPKPKM